MNSCEEHSHPNLTSLHNASLSGEQTNIADWKIKFVTFIDLELDSCRRFDSIYQQFVRELVLIIITVIVLIWMLNR